MAKKAEAIMRDRNVMLQRAHKPKKQLLQGHNKPARFTEVKIGDVNIEVHPTFKKAFGK